MKILMAAGSSGGHIFPAIATALKLREIDAKNEVFFVGTRKNLDMEILKNEGYNFDTISASKKVASDIFASFRIMRRFKPDVAVGFGGYVSFPALSAAKALGITTVIHEQNLVPGLANRMLANIADVIGVSFRETRVFFLGKSRVRSTGNPIRGNLARLKKEEALRLLGLKEGVFTVLVMGGSQGAHFINDAVLEMLRDMTEEERRYFQFIHLSGLNDFKFVKSGYESLGLGYKLFAFCDVMSEVYSASDLVISRAGASSVSELLFFGLPSILVPYPSARVHQIENAEYMEDKGAAVVIRQENLSGPYLKEAVIGLFRDRYRLRQLAEGAASLFIPDAAGKFATEIIRNVGTG